MYYHNTYENINPRDTADVWTGVPKFSGIPYLQEKRKERLKEIEGEVNVVVYSPHSCPYLRISTAIHTYMGMNTYTYSCPAYKAFLLSVRKQKITKDEIDDDI